CSSDLVHGDLDRRHVGARREVAELDDQHALAAVAVSGADEVDDLDRRLGALSECRHGAQQEGDECEGESSHRRANGSGSNRSAGSRMPWFSRSSEKVGRIPVALRRPMYLPSSSTPMPKSNRKRSCRVMISPSMPSTSVMWVMRRVPSLRRETWTIRLMADATCSRIARTGRSKPAMSTMVSIRDRVSRGPLE